MSDLRKAAQMALEALINGISVRNGEGGTKYQPPLETAAIEAIHAALAQPEPLEPAGEEDMKVYAAIAEGYGRLEKRIGCVQHDCDVCQARVFAQPEQLVVDGDDLPTLTKWTPQRKPLTEADIKGIVDLGLQTWKLSESTVEFARAIERVHGIGGEE